MGRTILSPVSIHTYIAISVQGGKVHEVISMWSTNPEGTTQRTATTPGNFTPYSFRIVCGFNVPHWTYKHGRYLKEMLYAVRCLKSNEDMILALAWQFKQLNCSSLCDFIAQLVRALHRHRRIPLSHLNFSGSWDNCLNCQASARIISSFDGRYCETGPTVYSPYPRRLESLIICWRNYKGSTLYSVILRPWVLVGPESNSRPPAWQPDAQPTEPPVNNIGRHCLFLFCQ